MLSWFKRLVYRIFPGFTQSASGFGVYPIARVNSSLAVQPLFLSEIPQDYTHLLIECQLKINNSSTPPILPFSSASIKFNLDGIDYNYHTQSISAKNGVQDFQQMGGSSYIGKVISSGAVLKEYSPFFILIPNYSNPNLVKRALISSAYQLGYGANGFTQFGMGSTVVSWTKSDPINMITITPDQWISGHYFDAGSYMKVFGIKDGLDSSSQV